MTRLKTQQAKIKQHLESGKSLTPLTALKLYGSFRLSGVIFTLKKKYGMKIKTTIIHKGGKHYASYRLVKKGCKK